MLLFGCFSVVFLYSFLCFSVFYTSYWSYFWLKIGDFTKGKVYLYVRVVANGHLYDCNGFYVLFEYILRLMVGIVTYKGDVFFSFLGFLQVFRHEHLVSVGVDIYIMYLSPQCVF